MTRRSLIEVLAWCLPALLVGLVLRCLMAASMPFAYVQHDSIRLLVAGNAWLGQDFDVMTNNVPFLVPGFCRLAQNGSIPALTTIQLVQHFLGLIQILFAGGLVRHWFPRWKVWIIPVTTVIAIHPSFLWYEHTVMLETFYVFALMLVALSGTLLTEKPTLIRAAGLCASILVVAVTRPEGKLLLAFGAMLLGLVFWKKWRQFGAAAVLWLSTALVIRLATVSGESGLLIYSSVLHLSPERPKEYPTAAPYIAALRAEAVDRAAREPAFVSRPQREALDAALTNYVKDYPDVGRGKSVPERLNAVAASIARESCLSNPLALLPLAAQKFRATAGDLAHGKMTEAWLHERQIDRVRGAWRFLQPITQELWGRSFANADQAGAFVSASFPREVRWFIELHDEWADLYEWRFGATRYETMQLPGLPLFYLLPIAGMLAAVLWRSPMRRFHVTWILMLAALWFIIMVTANERSRFRMAFEPFIFLYALLAIALVGEGFVWVWRRMRSPNRIGATPRSATS